MRTSFLTKKRVTGMQTGEAKANPMVAWTGTGGIDVSACFSRATYMCVHMHVPICVPYISSLRGSESSKTPVARSTFNSHVLVSKCN